MCSDKMLIVQYKLSSFIIKIVKTTTHIIMYQLKSNRGLTCLVYACPDKFQLVILSSHMTLGSMYRMQLHGIIIWEVVSLGSYDYKLDIYFCTVL